MKQSWTKNLTPEKAAIIKADYVVSLGARRRLVELVNDKLRVCSSVKRSKESYDSPNWPYLQADAVGYERALFEIISLISDKDENI
jgi:hypothetical protein